MSKTLMGVLVAIVVVAGLWFVLKSKGENTVVAPTTNETSSTTNEATKPAEPAMAENASSVSIRATGFEPQALTVKVGTKVTWTNKSDVAGNVSSAVHPTHLVYPPLNLGDVAAGQSVSLTFDKAGTYKYHNHLNPSQFGSVVVE